MAVRDRVVGLSEPVHVAITLAAPAQHLDGELQFERLDVAAPAAVPVPFGPALPVRYEGMAAEKLNLVVDAPATNGLYRVALYTKTAAERHLAGFDDVFVQLET